MYDAITKMGTWAHNVCGCLRTLAGAAYGFRINSLHPRPPTLEMRTLLLRFRETTMETVVLTVGAQLPNSFPRILARLSDPQLNISSLAICSPASDSADKLLAVRFIRRTQQKDGHQNMKQEAQMWHAAAGNTNYVEGSVSSPFGTPQIHAASSKPLNFAGIVLNLFTPAPRPLDQKMSFCPITLEAFLRVF